MFAFSSSVIWATNATAFEYAAAHVPWPGMGAEQVSDTIRRDEQKGFTRRIDRRRFSIEVTVLGDVYFSRDPILGERKRKQCCSSEVPHIEPNEVERGRC